MESFENRVKKKFIVTGCVLILVGILGAIFVEPLLLTPRHSTAYLWFWHNVRYLIAAILVAVGVLLIVGIFTKIPSNEQGKKTN